jgi:hypothetical protein
MRINNQQSHQKDERRAECPNCHMALFKIPGAKTKCPYCNEFMFVRTRPKDNIRVVVTKKEADKIDEDWMIVAGTHDIFIAEKNEFSKEKEILRKKFEGKEPSDNDVRWGLLNKQLIKHSKNSDWGLYRNTRFQMAEILCSEMKFKDALLTYLEVCYLDLNGCRNVGGMDNPEILKEFPPFNPEELAFLAPGVIDLVKRIILKLNLSKKEVKQIFIDHNSRSEKSLRLPLSVERAWILLNKEI